MSRRSQQPRDMIPEFEKIPKTRSRCVSCLCVSWKVLTCFLSHGTLIALVVSYCILGAFTFNHLESENEKTVKKGIVYIRGNVTDHIWKMTEGSEYLHPNKYIEDVLEHLIKFETDIIESMKIKGWDGIEDDEQIQWTFSGALFYSIIVITTIGYGHIAPKTNMGKITTIFYAILGIPLMLLCLSNIGDLMASSFRFLYWRVCCFVCTRTPKKNRNRSRLSRASTIRGGGLQARSQPPPSMRRSMRVSKRSNVDWEFDSNPGLGHAFSDTELRYTNIPEQTYHNERERQRDRNFNSSTINRNDYRTPNSRNRVRHTVERDKNIHRYNPRFGSEAPESPIDRRQSQQRNIRSMSTAPSSNKEPFQKGHSRYSDITPNMRSISVPRSPNQRAQSLDRRMHKKDPIELENEKDMTKTPVLCNKYAIDELDRECFKRAEVRCQSLPRPRTRDRLQPVAQPSPPPSHRMRERDPYYMDDNCVEMQPIKKHRRRTRPEAPSPSPRIMSPMGFAINRQARYVPRDNDSLYDDDSDAYYAEMANKSRPVPIWLCVFLVVGYILAGAYLFHEWEQWDFLDAAYFCFITLTTIGFGDFVPARGVRENSEISIALCSLYLLFGIALLAMSFNLVQEEVIANVKSVARRLGILKEEQVDY